ncbi:AGC family protein kinase [Tritrichomonas foetus]|uniref:AGC family protein kinase n=1 Tax=Tritrichomonas foetus TaxID=1144522 RepID=A0A1J4JLX8_9EUKA|nr:AGC family protein kinase [Tritrichomonas foetus]|eukprot:OHS99697.1 AGC family protein kinase [Tritrichomonas foetus]
MNTQILSNIENFIQKLAKKLHIQNMESLVSLRGWLKQKTSLFHKDRTWFVVLIDNTLSLYTNEILTQPEESYSLKDIIDVHSLCTSSIPSFQIRFKDSLPITFQCPSVLECERWICALSTQHSMEKVTIDDFVLIRVIGRGASGKVFLARQKKSSALYAIKVIRKDKLKKHARESRVVAERNILMLANHQFITRLFCAFQTPTKFYFVLEYIAGGDLRHHLEKDINLSPFQIKLYLAEIIIALRTVHKLGIIYRDLKPENILLDLKGHIKLADFGLARQIDSSDEEKFSFCGTYEYLAPEMLREEPQTFTLDWWALGILAYRLIVGHLPFRSANRQRLFDMILNTEPRIPPTLGKDETSFIQSLLNKDPTKRLGSIGTDITRHPYFKGIIWSQVAKMGYDPEFLPYISRDDSVSNFDMIFTEESPIDSFVDENAINLGSVNVRNFSMNNGSAITSIVSFDDLTNV